VAQRSGPDDGGEERGAEAQSQLERDVDPLKQIAGGMFDALRSRPRAREPWRRFSGVDLSWRNAVQT